MLSVPVGEEPDRGNLWRARTWLHGPGIVVGVCLSEATAASLLASLPLILVGLLWRTWALGHIRKDCELCTTGPYSLVRHPLYLGNIVVLVGLLILANSWLLACIVVPIAAVYYAMVIIQEERWLRWRFADDWPEYCAQVPCIIPRLHRPSGEFSLSLAIANQAPLNWVLVGLVMALLILKPWILRAFQDLSQ